MDPITISALSSAAVSLLSPYLKTLAGKIVEKSGESIGKAVGEGAHNKAKELYDAIRKRFSSNPIAEQALNKLVTFPDDKKQQVEVEQKLKEAVSIDDSFGTQLKDILEGYVAAGGDNVFNTNIKGDVQKFVQIGNVEGDVNI